MITEFANRRIRAQLENQLRTSGQFDPMLLLVCSGRLAKQSFASWGKGNGGRLEDHLLGKVTTIVQEC